MTDWIERLKAAIDEDEEFAADAAEQVGDGNWQQRNVRIVTVADRDREVADYAIVECIDHIVRHDPARVLAMVAAHREIMQEHRAWPDYGPACRGCGLANDGDSLVADVHDCPVLQALAKGYGIEA